ncbi:SOS-induced cell division inhibitor SulA [Pseudomonas sp. RIT-PI-AD]|uniref:SOS-induced cell division inhibitor SulA n=1 Tax=Pseudomonas sp. RIT-PI-AD TaxID=3035294 RepID=UPI0021D8B8F3|nr:SOS-induced cell division inhibitor SulA [Pseudomonas sp. RIT-PI-AD]
MQFPQSLDRTQLSLFQEALFSQPVIPMPPKTLHDQWLDEREAFSEVTLKGSTGNCQHLLAPILRALSEDQDARWLTLVAPPAEQTQAWLRKVGLNRERILLLQPRGDQTSLQLACEALRLGRSHTVVSWLNPLDKASKQRLAQAARQGEAQSLNIRLG